MSCALPDDLSDSFATGVQIERQRRTLLKRNKLGLTELAVVI
jgi:hypothetical protein